MAGSLGDRPPSPSDIKQQIQRAQAYYNAPAPMTVGSDSVNAQDILLLIRAQQQLNTAPYSIQAQTLQRPAVTTQQELAATYQQLIQQQQQTALQAHSLPIYTQTTALPSQYYHSMTAGGDRIPSAQPLSFYSSNLQSPTITPSSTFSLPSALSSISSASSTAHSPRHRLQKPHESFSVTASPRLMSFSTMSAASTSTVAGGFMPWRHTSSAPTSPRSMASEPMRPQSASLLSTLSSPLQFSASLPEVVPMPRVRSNPTNESIPSTSWQCPSGCGKVLNKRSFRSIKKHKQTCQQYQHYMTFGQSMQQTAYASTAIPNATQQNIPAHMITQQQLMMAHAQSTFPQVYQAQQEQPQSYYLPPMNTVPSFMQQPMLLQLQQQNAPIQLTPQQQQQAIPLQYQTDFNFTPSLFLNNPNNNTTTNNNNPSNFQQQQ